MTIQEFKNMAEMQNYSFPSFYGSQYELFGLYVYEINYTDKNPLFDGKKETTFFIEKDGEKRQVSEQRFLEEIN